MMKVIRSIDNILVFDTGLVISGCGEIDCCAVNYLDFEQIPVGHEFDDMDSEEMRETVEKNLKDDGFTLRGKDGVPKWVQARSWQNGYYSNETHVSVDGERVGRVFGKKQEE